MATIAGRNARLYLAIASNGTAEPAASIKTFSLDQSTEKFDVTVFGSTNREYKAGLPDASGSFSGYFDTTTNTTFSAAQDGVARKFYFYPDHNTTSSYFFGTGTFDFNTSFDVGGVGEVSGNWSAASTVVKVG